MSTLSYVTESVLLPTRAFNNWSMTRRWFLLAPFFSLVPAFGATDFWNRKPAKDWTEQEIHQLITKSPWAQTGRVDPKGGVVLSAPNDRDPKASIANRPATMPVCWDSAQPVLDALGDFLPRGFEGHYVIGVDDREYRFQPSTSSATLGARGKEPVQAGAVQRSRDGATIFFGFSKELLPLSASDSNVLFAVDTDQIAVKAKFEPKEMIYRGKLAL
jgi:hypothetical protein